MESKYEEFKICQKRGHQKSGRTQIIDGKSWELCRHCTTAFRYVTELKEINSPTRHD